MVPLINQIKKKKISGCCLGRVRNIFVVTFLRLKTRAVCNIDTLVTMH